MIKQVNKEHPILFSTEMVKAILAGNKTQTRRIINPQPRIQKKCSQTDSLIWIWQKRQATTVARERALPDYLCEMHNTKAGDLLWVRETWAPIPEARPSGYFSNPEMIGKDYWYRASDCLPSWGGPWKPSIHMPRRACRLTMKVTKVRVERIQDISTDDVIAEGFPRDDGPMRDGTRLNAYGRKMCFAELWDSLNESRGYGWDTNPWVWVYDFQLMDQESDT